MKFSVSPILVICGLACASTASLSAQFITANSQEAMGYGVALEQGHAAVRSAAEFALANARTAQGLTGGFDFSNVDTDRSGTRLFEGDIDQSAFHLNYGHAIGDLIASLQLSYFDTKAESDYRDGAVAGQVELDAEGWFLASTLAYAWEGFNFSFLGGLGQLSSDSTRTSVAIPTPKTGSFDSKFYTLGFAADYTIYQEDALTVTPRIGLNYSKVDADSFNERIVGPVLDRGALDSMNRDWLIGSLEVLLGWQASEQLALQAALGWHYDFNHSSTTISGVDNAATPGRVDIPDVGESFFKGGLSADYTINENWALGANTSYLSGDDLSGFSIGASLSYRF
jgi:hypothetical protein